MQTLELAAALVAALREGREVEITARITGRGERGPGLVTVRRRQVIETEGVDVSGGNVVPFRRAS